MKYKNKTFYKLNMLTYDNKFYFTEESISEPESPENSKVDLDGKAIAQLKPRKRLDMAELALMGLNNLPFQRTIKE